ncbi:MAG: YcbK family protein [Kiloniellaceae bacterium]
MGLHAERRKFLTFSLAAAAAALACPAVARAHAKERAVAFYNMHTGESLEAVYWAAGTYVEQSLREIAVVLRDHRTGEIKAIDPRLIDALHALRGRVGSRRAFHVISGYRSPKTNAMLRRKSAGVARKSYHMRGMAADLFLPDRDLRALHRAALAMKAGGVGYYPNPGFIHLDTGRVRSW